LIDDAKRYESVRQIRRPDSVRRVGRQSDQIKRRGLRQRQRECQRYYCKACKSDFDDLTNTIFANYQRSNASGNYRDRGCVPHRGISQERLPIYLGIHEFMYNVRKRGKALLGSLLALLLN
jgi:hypothetical protein